MVLAIAQIGVHLVFFLHITTGPDNVNNVLALAFGVFIVFLLIVGSLWIMYNLNQNWGRCRCRWDEWRSGHGLPRLGKRGEGAVR